MGTQFQKEYIEYLQQRNSELLDKINEMKETYDNKIFSKVNKCYHTSLIGKILSVCTALPQEIDIFFDEMKVALNTLKSILLKKSEMVQLVEKMSETFYSNDTASEIDNYEPVRYSGTPSKNCGTAKVSPMINGHIISTEPRIYLNRVPNNFNSIKKIDATLSPIAEGSPPNCYNKEKYREPIVFLEKVDSDNLNYMFDAQGSPEHSPTTNASWKKRCSSNEINNSPQSSIYREKFKKQINDIPDVGENNNTEICARKNEMDPLEGPSWLYRDPISTESTSVTSFVDCRRRRQRYSMMYNTLKGVPKLYCNEKEDKPCIQRTEEDYLSTQNVECMKENEPVDFKASSNIEVIPEEDNHTLDQINASDCIEETPQKIVQPSAKKRTKATVPPDFGLKQVVINLTDCLSNSPLNTSNPQKPKPKKKKESDIPQSLERKLLSSGSLSGENNLSEGRKKRKAAPTNLSEPSLITKLRRG